MKSPTFLVSAISIESRWKIIGEAPNYACARESARFAGLWYSRDFEPAETTACNCDCVIWQSFNGAAVLKPRREQNNNSIRGLYMGFNGAAVYKPRRGAAVMDEATRCKASMGPRFINRGETDFGTDFSRIQWQLQWGRGL